MLPMSGRLFLTGRSSLRRSGSTTGHSTGKSHNVVSGNDRLIIPVLIEVKQTDQFSFPGLVP